MIEALTPHAAAHDLVLAVICIVATVLAALLVPGRIAHSLEHVHHASPNTRILVTRAAYLLIVVTGLSVAVGLAGYTALPFFTLGTVGLVVGLSLQGFIQQIIAGATLLEQHQFAPGDGIECVGYSGTIEDVQLRYIRLRDATGRKIIMPNLTLLTNPYIVEESPCSPPSAPGLSSASLPSSPSLPPPPSVPPPASSSTSTTAPALR